MKLETNTQLVIQRYAAYLIGLSGFIVLLSFIWLGQYAHPSSDDFCMAAGVRQEGLFPHLWNHYVEWSGRYSGNALYAIYPLIFGMFSGLVFIPALLILLLFLSCSFFLSRLFRLGLFSKPVLLISLVFVTVFLLGMKHTASSLYWPAGALSYQTANILLMFTLGLMVSLCDRLQQQNSYYGVLFTLIIVIVLGMGTNETNMLALSGIVALAFLFQLRSGWSSVKPWLILSVITLGCFAIVYFAPGNAVREASFPLRHDFTRAVYGSLDMGWWVLMGWLLNPLFIVATLLTPFAITRLYSLSPCTFTLSNASIVFVILLTLALPFVLQFPAWWAMGGWPPPRTVDATFFVFLLSWFLMLGVLTIRFVPADFLNSSGKYFSTSNGLIFSMGAVLFMLAVAGNFKFQRVQQDLWLRAEPFNAYMLQRYALINQSVTHKHLALLVPAFNQEFPRSIYFNDIVPDYRDWRNACYADYFGLQVIGREKQLKKSDHKMKRISR